MICHPLSTYFKSYELLSVLAWLLPPSFLKHCPSLAAVSFCQLLSASVSFCHVSERLPSRPLSLVTRAPPRQSFPRTHCWFHSSHRDVHTDLFSPISSWAPVSSCPLGISPWPRPNLESSSSRFSPSVPWVIEWQWCGRRPVLQVRNPGVIFDSSLHPRPYILDYSHVLTLLLLE